MSLGEVAKRGSPGDLSWQHGYRPLAMGICERVYNSTVSLKIANLVYPTSCNGAAVNTQEHIIYTYAHARITQYTLRVSERPIVP